MRKEHPCGEVMYVSGQAAFAHDDDIDPRRVRSRNRLLDAAAGLLSTGGIEAVTIDAVTKLSKVARTTLYRHPGLPAGRGASGTPWCGHTDEVLRQR